MTTQFFNVDLEMSWYRMPHVDREINSKHFPRIDHVNSPAQEAMATAFMKQMRHYKPQKNEPIEIKVIEKPVFIAKPKRQKVHKYYWVNNSDLENFIDLYCVSDISFYEAIQCIKAVKPKRHKLKRARRND